MVVPRICTNLSIKTHPFVKLPLNVNWFKINHLRSFQSKIILQPFSRTRLPLTGTITTTEFKFIVVVLYFPGKLLPICSLLLATNVIYTIINLRSDLTRLRVVVLSLFPCLRCKDDCGEITKKTNEIFSNQLNKKM